MNLYMIVTLFLFLLSVAGLWGVFEKAGEKGWKVLIPFYNFYIWLQIIRKPLWWYIFLLVPFINVFVVLLMIVEVLQQTRTARPGAWGPLPLFLSPLAWV
jgi:hypothetical protein